MAAKVFGVVNPYATKGVFVSDAREIRSAVATVEHNLAQIEANDATIKANITVMAEQALADAHRLDKAAEQGQWLGPLHGMTIGVKDNINTAGVRTTMGSHFFADYVPDTDATVVTKLRAAGAIILSKVNLHEFAFGGTTQNINFGSCRNPWNTDHIPGGSSGGSGAAVAADMCVGSLGTDTAGSVRNPSSLNGIVGIRPTMGRVSNGGVFPVSHFLDTVGPMAHHAEDVARMLAVMEGYDPTDTSSKNGPCDELLRGLHDGIEGLKVGVPTNFFFDDVDPQIEARVRQALDVVASLGAELVELHVPGVEEAMERTLPIIYSDAAAVHAERIASEAHRFDPNGLERLNLGVNMTAPQYGGSMTWRYNWVRQLEAVFRQVDVIASPMVRVRTPRVDDVDFLATTHKLGQLSFGWALANVPALSMPVGFVDGLPVGMQLAGAWWRDGMLLRTATAYQSVTDWHNMRPALVV